MQDSSTSSLSPRGNAVSRLSVEKSELTTVTVLMDKTKVANIERNIIILKAVPEAVLLCGRQCVALRGDNESLKEDNSGNIENF